MNNKIKQIDGVVYKKIGTLRNFNSIECPVPTNCIDCVISITNDGKSSDTSLLYKIYNGSCQRCYSKPLRCEIQLNACAIKSRSDKRISRKLDRKSIIAFYLISSFPNLNSSI